MITSLEITINAVRIRFDGRHSGVFSCFGEKVILKNSESISLEYKDNIAYDNNFKFKPDGGEEENVVYDYIKLLDPNSILNPKDRGVLQSPEAVFFIARNIANHHREVIRRCNAAVVMCYRAIELDRGDLVFYSMGVVDALSTELSFLLGKKQPKMVKLRPEHVMISLQYIKSLLSLYLCDEKSFIDGLNASLEISRETTDKAYLDNSYFSLVLVHKLIASYIGRELSFIIFDESFYLSKDSYSALGINNNAANRIREVSLGIVQLSKLRAFCEREKLDEKEFFTSSLRCEQKNELYNNFKKFKRAFTVNLKPLSDINNKTIDVIRDKAIRLEGEGDIKSAMDLMKSALMARPNGPFIRQKYIQYCKRSMSPGTP